VTGVLTGFCQALFHLGRKALVGIGGLGNDAHHPIFVDGDYGPAVLLVLSKLKAGGPVHHMPRIQQGDDHIDIGQGPHQSPY
jgi:hypothetical protein